MFIENEIDGDAFGMLSKETVKELIPAVGIRVKFQKASSKVMVSEMAEGSSTVPDSSDAGTSAENPAPTHCSTLSNSVIREN